MPPLYAWLHAPSATTGTPTLRSTSDSEPPDEVVPHPDTVSGVPALSTAASGMQCECAAPGTVVDGLWR